MFFVISSLTSCNFSNVIICFKSFFISWSKEIFLSIITLEPFILIFGGTYLVCASLSYLYSNVKTKILFSFQKLKSIKMKSKYWSCHSNDTFDWYLFQFIVLLKQSFNCSSSFTLSWVDKVTNGT